MKYFYAYISCFMFPVIALDIDPKKIELARYNASIYGVAEKIEFVVGDFFVVGRNLRADVVVTSPPRGGPQYVKHNTYDLIDLCPDQGGVTAVLEICKEIAPRLALHLPKNVDKIKVCLGFFFRFYRKS